MSDQSDIGLIGLGVMGRGLAENLTRHARSVAAFEPLEESAHGDCQTLKELMERLSSPRIIMLMVPAGEPVDRMLEALEPLLDEGDVVIDGGNSFFKDSMERAAKFEKHGVHFVDAGISGGAAGALEGVSLMAGGSDAALKLAEPFFKDIAEEADGTPCYGHMGPAGSGHFVKMVHNGMEYAVMQAIAEADYLLERLGGLSHAERGDLFAAWSRRELSSYLVEITAKILAKTDDDTGRPLLDVILDQAAQKGTGQWAASTALELGVAAPTIAEAVFARSLSCQDRAPSKSKITAEGLSSEHIEKALLAAIAASFDQGFKIIESAAQAYGWPLQRQKITGVWSGGCIVRASLLTGPPFNQIMAASEGPLRTTVLAAIKNALPVPALCSVLTYWDAYKSELLWANMIQAQRDYFGAHGYRRIDKDGDFHTDWSKK